jgi:AraC family transcriptional regulator
MARLPHIARSSVGAAPDAGSRGAWVGRIVEHLGAHLIEPPSLASLAAIARVHPVQVSRGFRKRVGCTITEFVRRRRVERACEMIRESDMSLTRIAFTVGFTEQAHFTRSFRRVTGMTPSAFRLRSRRARSA